LSPGVVEAADLIVEVSLDFTHAIEAISKLKIDILVFADVLSEPMNHFLTHSRLANFQVAFWGNPITSGSEKVDFFVSADVMEHPFRCRMPLTDEPYTEQIVMMEGQGIWYSKPQDPEGEIID
jgi:predicted O-linked N-acetylglucosamine transferase (SPINDLY family)